MKNSDTPVRIAGSGSTEFPWKWSLEDLDGIPKNGCTVFSCFSCGGGSSMGYKLAGFEVVGCCEIDPRMMDTYRANNHPKFEFLMDIRDFLQLPEEKLPKAVFGLDVLDGSPPCSVFSMAGGREKNWNVEKAFREGQAKQRLDDLFLFFLETAKKLRPKTIIAENVKGLIIGKSKGWVNLIIKAFNDAGYRVQIFLLNSATMGVPQKRERVFFIAHRKDLEYPRLRLEFHGEPIPFGKVREDTGKMPAGDSLTYKMMEYRQPGDRSLADISKRLRKKSSGFSNPINCDEEPAATITAGGSLYRFSDGLLMTDRDIINCQTFPQDYDFRGQSVQYVCGMSVPPVMMAKVAEQVYQQWLRP